MLLFYLYNVLELYIFKEIMMLYYDKYYWSYVEGLNKVEKMMEEVRKINKFDLIKYWEREVVFYGLGYYLYMIFWNNMKKDGGGSLRGIFL